LYSGLDGGCVTHHLSLKLLTARIIKGRMAHLARPCPSVQA